MTTMHSPTYTALISNNAARETALVWAYWASDDSTLYNFSVYNSDLTPGSRAVMLTNVRKCLTYVIVNIGSGDKSIVLQDIDDLLDLMNYIRFSN